MQLAPRDIIARSSMILPSVCPLEAVDFLDWHLDHTVNMIVINEKCTIDGNIQLPCMPALLRYGLQVRKGRQPNATAVPLSTWPIYLALAQHTKLLGVYTLAKNQSISTLIPGICHLPSKCSKFTRSAPDVNWCCASLFR